MRGNRASYGCRGGRGRTRSSTVSASEFLLYEITISGGLLLLFLRMHFLKRSYYYCVIYFFISLYFLTTSIDKNRHHGCWLQFARGYGLSYLFIPDCIHDILSVRFVKTRCARPSFKRRYLSHNLIRSHGHFTRLFVFF